MPIPKDKIDQIRAVVRQHVDWFIGRVFGSQFTDEQAHVDAPDSVQGLPTSLTQMSFVLGKEEAQLKETEWKGYSWDDMAHAAEQVTSEEQAQIDAAVFSTHTKFRKLGDDVANGVFERLSIANSEAVSEAQVRGIIADKIETGVLLGRSHSAVAQELIRTLQDKSRDWYRVAATELHHARQTGVVHAITNKLGIYSHGEGPNSKVAIVPASDACQDCIRLYLENGKPKIFQLSELLQNTGTNYVRPWRSNAKPVIPPLHPNCYCMLRYVPPGWGWNDKGKFTMTKPEEAFPDQLGKSVDSVSHSLLQGSNASLPTEDYIRQIDDPEELQVLKRRLKKLEQMYIRDRDIHERLKHLLHEAKVQWIRVSGVIGGRNSNE